MEITEQEKQRMNEIYFTLSTKQAQLFHGLYHRIFELTSGFYNGHERQTLDGSWQMDYYPSPVISVKGFFDVEISPDGISAPQRKSEKIHWPIHSKKCGVILLKPLAWKAIWTPFTGMA